MSSPDTTDVGVQPGDVLAGKYRVERVLGTGGMGVVVAAHHLQLDQKVAIKFLRPAAVGKPELLVRFEREARAAVRIKSEHVARVIDVGHLESGSPYIVMEHLEGGDLRAWLQERGPMKAEQVAEFVLQACEAIAEAHALGIVHRDLKPANLFCIRRADGLLSIKVLDFGISKVAPGASGSSADLDMTSTGAVVGSPLYMSPEQLKSSREVDARTDIWSLGVILYELLAGRQPFKAESITELAIEVATGMPPSLRMLVPELPEGFEDVVDRCLKKDRNQRIQSVGELAIALKDYAPKRAAGSVDRVLRTMEASGASLPQKPPSGMFRAAYADTISAHDVKSATNATWGQTGASKKKRERRTVYVVAGGLVVVVLLAGRVMMTRSPGDAGMRVSTAASGAAPVAPPVSASAASLSAQAGTDTTPVPAAPSVSVDVPMAGLASPLAASTRPGSPATRRQPSTSPPPTATTSAAPATTPPPPVQPAPTCRIVTEYDAEGQPHFKKVCN